MRVCQRVTDKMSSKIHLENILICTVYQMLPLQVSRGIASTSGRAQLASRTQVLPGQPRPG